MHGLLIVDKPTGMTSADVVRVVKQRWRCKTGHLGTLDPFASGVLPLCLGEGTKIAQFLNAADLNGCFQNGYCLTREAQRRTDVPGCLRVERPLPHKAGECAVARREAAVESCRCFGHHSGCTVAITLVAIDSCQQQESLSNGHFIACRSRLVQSPLGIVAGLVQFAQIQ